MNTGERELDISKKTSGEKLKGSKGVLKLPIDSKGNFLPQNKLASVEGTSTSPITQFVLPLLPAWLHLCQPVGGLEHLMAITEQNALLAKFRSARDTSPERSLQELGAG